MPQKKQPAKYKHQLPLEKMLKLRNDLPEMMKKKVANMEVRKNVLQTQARDNYINEYHRLHGAPKSRRIPTLDHNRVLNRLEELKHLTNESFHAPQSAYAKSAYAKLVTTTG